MTYAYRFVIDGTGIDFVAPGELQKFEGCLIVVAQVSFDQALALREHQTAGRAITLYVEVGGRDVAFMPVHKIKGRVERGNFVEVGCIVHLPSLFEQARKQ